MSKEALKKKELNNKDELSLPNDIARFEEKGLLDALLLDRTTGSNIIWATNAYEHLGEGFASRDAITPAGVTGNHANNIRRRARKEKEEQSALTRAHAEVFTPAWIVKFMVDAADDVWRDDLHMQDGQEEWQAYVASLRLEITCGEAPYLVNRYDASDGSVTPLSERTGILSRKLALVNANAKARDEWIEWAKAAVQSVYGYEFQGDNLLIARINVLCTLEDYLAASGFEKLTPEEYEEFADIISWNLWQMDGLTKCVPFGTPAKDKAEASFFDLQDGALPEEETKEDCIIYDWVNDKQIEFASIRKGSDMKFDYIIGNPPYQEEQEGDNKNFAPPIYDKFMDETYKVADKVELISPARFLFDAGSTPKAWNEKMLNDPHLKVEYYEPDSAKVFPSTDIKGGVAITYRDSEQNFGAIKIFTAFPELTSIYKKAGCESDDLSLSSIIYTQVRFNLDSLYTDHPELSKVIGSNGKDKRFRNNIFDKVNLFKDDSFDGAIKTLGIQKNKRVWKYIDSVYVDMRHESINKWKVLVPRANGSGALGEVLSTPLIGAPLIGYTQSFIAIGSFNSEQEAKACLKYVKSKFARVLLGILKITQDNDRGVWRYIPLQDFTSSSDIDWSQSVHEIDEQLYKKYGLSADEIEFIETHVKAMD